MSPMPVRSAARRQGRLLALLVLCSTLAWSGANAQDVRLPNRPDSVKFVAIGDFGTGSRQQREVAAQMDRFRSVFPFEVVITLGDNIYGGQGPEDLEEKFALPYKPLLSAGVAFFASLGNHDDPENRHYPLWNMNGQRYYTFTRGNVRFFALDSTSFDPEQVAWLEEQLRQSTDDWKIVYMHHPLYSSAGRHGSQLELRAALEPLFVKHGVRVVFSGHDHVYERIQPQRGIHYVVAGAAGQLRPGNLRRSSITAVGFDRDQSFVLAEVSGDTLTLQAVSRLGLVVDFVRIERLP
jgi:3',5'-cyclic AMP phosphodiesterase CpdA